MKFKNAINNGNRIGNNGEDNKNNNNINNKYNMDNKNIFEDSILKAYLESHKKKEKEIGRRK